MCAFFPPSSLSGGRRYLAAAPAAAADAGPVPGQRNLADCLDKAGIECLNQSDDHTVLNLLQSDDS